MANDNETVEQVCEVVGDLCSNSDGSFETINGERVYVTLLAKRILAAHKREIDELKTQVSIAKDAFFKIVQCKHSQAVHDIVCEAEFMMNHPDCRKEVSNG